MIMNDIETIKKLCFEQWSNDACLGYVQLAAINIGYPKENIIELLKALENTFGNYSVEEAKKRYLKLV